MCSSDATACSDSVHHYNLTQKIITTLHTVLLLYCKNCVSMKRKCTNMQHLSEHSFQNVCMCAPFTVCVCVCGCKVKTEGQNVFSHRTEPSLQHPQCSGGDMHLAARHQLANEISPCCHVSIPAIPALADMKSVLHFS